MVAAGKQLQEPLLDVADGADDPATTAASCADASTAPTRSEIRRKIFSAAWPQAMALLSAGPMLAVCATLNDWRLSAAASRLQARGRVNVAASSN